MERKPRRNILSNLNHYNFNLLWPQSTDYFGSFMYWISKMSFLYGYSCERYKQNTLVFSHIKILIRPFLVFFFLPFWRAVRSYWPHLDIRDPIWGDDRSHRLLLSPSWDFLGFSSAVRKMPGDLCIAPGIISLATTWHSGQVAFGYYEPRLGLVVPPH